MHNTFFSFYQDGGIVGLDFTQIIDDFRKATMTNGETYLSRWTRGEGPEELLEIVLYDYICDNMKAKPLNAIEFNILVNAMIVALEDGDYNRYLEENPAQFFARCLSESDAERFIAPGENNPLYKHYLKFWTAQILQAERLFKFDEAVGRAKANIGNY